MGQICPNELHLLTEFPRLNEGGVDLLNDWLEENKACRLIVIDTLAKVAPKRKKGANDYSYSDDYEYASEIQKLALSRNVAIIAIHHTTKAKAEYALDEVSGTTGLTGAADSILVMSKSRNVKNGGILWITGRDVEEQELAMQYDTTDSCWVLMGDAKEHAITQERKAVLAILKEFKQPMSPKDVAAALNQPDGTIRILMHRMEKDRIIGQLGYGKYMINMATNINIYD